MSTREHHVHVREDGTMERQAWVFSHATGWAQVDLSQADEWPERAYTYHSWPHPIPTHPKGPHMPPRVAW